MRFKLAISLASLLALCVAASAASAFDGVWHGTFNGQPTRLAPDGSYPESVTKFELRLQEGRGGVVTGEFHEVGVSKPTARSIKNGKRFDDRACFDIVIEPDDDMRWCVQVKGRDLTGSWSAGPEGGPMLGGAGTGARFFQVTGSRAN